MSHSGIHHPDSTDPLPIRTENVPVEGGICAVARCGDPQAPAVVFLHGNSSSGTGHPSWWSWIARAGFGKSRPSAQVIAIDLPGHGGSPWNSTLPDYGLGTLANVVQSVLQALSIVRPCFIGHSLGGNIVLELLAAGVPIRGAAVLAATPLPAPPPPNGLEFPASLQVLFQANPSPLAIVGLAHDFCQEMSIKWFVDDFLAADGRVRAGLAEACRKGQWRDQVPVLALPPCPLAWLIGDGDPFAAFVDPDISWPQLWGGGLQRLPSVPHMMLDHPATIAMLRGFLRDLGDDKS